MANPAGNPAGKPPDELTLAHGGRRVKVDQRWPSQIVARVDLAARKASVKEGRPISRTEWTIRVLLKELDRLKIASGVDYVQPTTGRGVVQPIERPAGVPEQETCLHPHDARVQLGYMTRCGICNKRMDV